MLDYEDLKTLMEETNARNGDMIAELEEFGISEEALKAYTDKVQEAVSILLVMGDTPQFAACSVALASLHLGLMAARLIECNERPGEDSSE